MAEIYGNKFGVYKMNEQQIILGAGCFWGVEKHFKSVSGVLNVSVGYSGGQKNNRHTLRQIP